MLWICLAWYLAGVITTILSAKLCDGHVTVGTLTAALIGGGIAGPMMIGVVVVFVFANSEVYNKKLF